LPAGAKNKDPKRILKVEDGTIPIVEYPKPDGDSDSVAAGAASNFHSVSLSMYKLRAGRICVFPPITAMRRCSCLSVLPALKEFHENYRY
jgi:hypothetical protein